MWINKNYRQGVSLGKWIKFIFQMMFKKFILIFLWINKDYNRKDLAIELIIKITK